MLRAGWDNGWISGGEHGGLRSGFRTGKACESLCCRFCSSRFSLVPSLAGHTDLAYPAWLNTQPTGWFLSDTCSPAGPTNTHNYTSAHSPPTGMSTICVHAWLFFPHKFPTAWILFQIQQMCLMSVSTFWFEPAWIKCVLLCFSLLIIFKIKAPTSHITTVDTVPIWFPATCLSINLYSVMAVYLLVVECMPGLFGGHYTAGYMIQSFPFDIVLIILLFGLLTCTY